MRCATGGVGVVSEETECKMIRNVQPERKDVKHPDAAPAELHGFMHELGCDEEPRDGYCIPSCWPVNYSSRVPRITTIPARSQEGSNEGTNLEDMKAEHGEEELIVKEEHSLGYSFELGST